MIIAYVLEHLIGLAIVLAYLISVSLQHKGASYISRRCLEVFHDCATFLTFSIQIAAIVVLVRVDFGLGTENMGDATVRITQAVSILTLLPLAYATVLLHNNSSDAEVGRSEHPDERMSSNRRPNGETSKRFGLFVLCWLLSLYPFYSKMNSVFGPSLIGTTVISNGQFDDIEEICYRDVRVITRAEDRFMTALAIVAVVPLSLLVCGRIIVLGVRKHHADSQTYARMVVLLEGTGARRFRQSLVLSLGMIPPLACGLLWTVIRDQTFQQHMTAAAGNDFADGQWTFGQVVAVTVFVPVLVEAWFLFGEQRKQEGVPIDA